MFRIKLEIGYYILNKKKLNSSVYWNMDFKTLNQFKSLKRIKINDGEASSLLEVGMFELLFDKFPKGIKFTINGASFNRAALHVSIKYLCREINYSKKLNNQPHTLITLTKQLELIGVFTEHFYF